MGKNYGLIDLCENELKEISGGMRMLVISFFLPNFDRFQNFMNGLREGYEHTTSN